MKKTDDVVDRTEKQLTLSTVEEVLGDINPYYRVRYKTFVFPELKFGDGIIRAGAKLTILENGTVLWSAVVKSTDSNDTWNISFDFFRNDNAYLSHMPNPQNTDSYYFFKMEKANQWYAWERYPDNPWHYNERLFDSIAKVRFNYSC